MALEVNVSDNSKSLMHLSSPTDVEELAHLDDERRMDGHASSPQLPNSAGSNGIRLNGVGTRKNKALN